MLDKLCNDILNLIVDFLDTIDSIKIFRGINKKCYEIVDKNYEIKIKDNFPKHHDVKLIKIYSNLILTKKVEIKGFVKYRILVNKYCYIYYLGQFIKNPSTGQPEVFYRYMNSILDPLNKTMNESVLNIKMGNLVINTKCILYSEYKFDKINDKIKYKTNIKPIIMNYEQYNKYINLPKSIKINMEIDAYETLSNQNDIDMAFKADIKCEIIPKLKKQQSENYKEMLYSKSNK